MPVRTQIEAALSNPNPKDPGAPSPCRELAIDERSIARIWDSECLMAVECSSMRDEALASSVIREIEQDRPVGVRIRWSNGANHVVSICGYCKAESGVTFLVFDPAYGVERVQQWSLINAYMHDGIWTHLLTHRSGSNDVRENAPHR